MKLRYFIISLLLCILSFKAISMEENNEGAFDHTLWNNLLTTHVSSLPGANNTVVDYHGMSQHRGQLKRYLSALSHVKQREFDLWSNSDQLSFLINAYNAWTIELILTSWPDLDSIKDLGSLFRSPWRKRFALLLGKTYSLDEIEHGLIRNSGRYKDPRIHFAVNCASIGCPSLRAEAYVGTRLNQQLNEQTHIFLSDRNRNRIENGVVQLSSIFKWYREDFEKGWKGHHRLEDFLLANASALNLPDTVAAELRAGDGKIKFLKYDWRLNQK